MSIKWQEEKWLKASRNLQQFINDCEVKLRVVDCSLKAIECKDSEYYYEFNLIAMDYPDYKVKVTMPSFPLEKIRFKDERYQNQINYYKIYINDFSWLWKDALICKEVIVNELENRIHTLESEIKNYKKCLDRVMVWG